MSNHALNITAAVFCVIWIFLLIFLILPVRDELHTNYAKCYEIKKPKTSTSSHASRFSGKHKIVEGKLFCLDDNGSLYPWRGDE